MLERNGKKNLIISKRKSLFRIRKISKIEKNEEKFLPTKKI